MADLPRVWANPQIPRANLPRTNPNAYGAAAFKGIGEAAEDVGFAIVRRNAELAKHQAELMKIQDADDKVEVGKRLAQSKEDLEILAQRNELSIIEPEEFETRTKSDIEAFKRAQIADAPNERVKRMLSEALAPTIQRVNRGVELNAYKKRVDRAVRNVEDASVVFSRTATNAKSPGERDQAYDEFTRLVDFEQERNLLSENQAGDILRRFDSSVIQGRERAFAVELKPALYEVINAARTSPASASRLLKEGEDRILGAGFDMDPAKSKEMIGWFKDALWTSAAEGMIDRDPRGMKAQLKAGLFNNRVDQGSLRSLINKADTEVERLDRKAEAESKEGVRQIGKAVDDYKNAVMLGFRWAGNEGQLAAAVKGTEHEGEFHNARAQSRVLGHFNQMAPAMQEQYIRSIRSGAQSGESAKFIGSLERAHEATKGALKQDPLTFAVKQGVIENLPPLSVVDGGESFRARSRLAGIAEQRYGVAVSPLTDDESRELLKQFNSAPADGRTALLRSLTQGLDPRHVKSLAAQFAKQDAGMMAYTMGLSVESPQTASRLLQGHDILKSNKDVLPKGVDLSTARNRIASAVGEAFQRNPEHYAAMSEAALNLYALKSWQEQDLSGTIDTKRLDSAIQEATGGVITYKGQKIQAPKYGVNDAVFQDLLGRADYSKAKGFSKKDILSHGQLESVGDGRYLVKVGAGYVQGAESGPFILDLGEVLNRGMVGAKIGAAAAGFLK
jgi:hypothetical protein